MAYLAAAQQQHLAQVPQRQAVAQPTEHDEDDDVVRAASLGRQVRFSTPPLRSLNWRPQSRQRKRHTPEP